MEELALSRLLFLRAPQKKFKSRAGLQDKVKMDLMFKFFLRMTSSNMISPRN